MTGPNTLGEYLRARRELVDPATVGLRVAGVRRTPGLRREEAAPLAGISGGHSPPPPPPRGGPRSPPAPAGARVAGAGVRPRPDRHELPAEPGRGHPGAVGQAEKQAGAAGARP